MAIIRPILEQQLKRKEMSIERLAQVIEELLEKSEMMTLCTDYSWYAEGWVNPYIGGYVTNKSVGYLIPCMDEIQVDKALITILIKNKINVNKVKPYYYYLSLKN